MATVPPKAAETPCLANRPCLSEACLEVGLPTQSPADLITCVLGRCPPPGGSGPARREIGRGFASTLPRAGSLALCVCAAICGLPWRAAASPGNPLLQYRLARPGAQRALRSLQGSAPMGWNLPPSQRCSCSRKHGLRPEKACAERISPSGYLEPKWLRCPPRPPKRRALQTAPACLRLALRWAYPLRALRT